MELSGFEPLASSPDRLKFLTVEPIMRVVKPFYAARIASPIPGEIGQDGATYIAILGMQGLDPKIIYEHHKELVHLGTTYPDLPLAEYRRVDIDRFL